MSLENTEASKSKKMTTIDVIRGILEISKEVVIMVVLGILHLRDVKNEKEIVEIEALSDELTSQVGKVPTAEIEEKLESHFNEKH